MDNLSQSLGGIHPGVAALVCLEHIPGEDFRTRGFQNVLTLPGLCVYSFLSALSPISELPLVEHTTKSTTSVPEKGWYFPFATFRHPSAPCRKMAKKNHTIDLGIVPIVSFMTKCI